MCLIIPFFEKYPLLSSRALALQDFRKVANLISFGAHSTPSGLEEIRSIKARMNSKRRFE